MRGSEAMGSVARVVWAAAAGLMLCLYVAVLGIVMLPLLLVTALRGARPDAAGQ